MIKNKGGRPATGATKTKRLAVTVSPECLALLDNLGAVHERSRGNLIEYLVKQESRKL